jgi:hypothetical protein
LDPARTRTKNGRDFAIGGIILAVALVLAADFYFSGQYGDTPAALVPWYAANSWVNLVVGIVAGGVMGWFVGISIPVSSEPDERQPWGKDPSLCSTCHRQNRKGDRFCEQCGTPLT